MSAPAVRPVDETNVDAAVELLYRCFGYTFSWPWVYDRGAILAAHDEGRAFWFLAYDGDGDVRGLLGLNRGYPTRQLASLAPFVVDPRVGRADSGRYLQLLLKEVEDCGWNLVVNDGLRALVAQPVCEHRLTQRLVKVVKFVTTGVLLGITQGGGDRLRVAPEDRVAGGDSLVRSADDFKRTSETLVVRAIPRGFPEPEKIVVPGRYAGLIEDIYAALRVAVEPAEPTPPTGETELECRYDFARSFVTIEVTRQGADAADAVLERLEHYTRGFTELCHVAVPLGGGDPGRLVEELCDWGCRFAGVLPCYRTSGVLLLQHLGVPAMQPTEEQLVDPLARRILREAIAV